MVSETCHLEQTKCTQVKHVKGLVGVMEKMGNSFMEDSNDLLRLDTQDILDPVVTSAVHQAEEMMGQQMYPITY